MTAEVAFAKSFLASLDSKPVKLQPDWAADPKTLELHGSVRNPFTDGNRSPALLRDLQY